MVKKLLTLNNFILLAILLFAAFMRLYRIADYMTFLGDEGRDMLVVYNILHGHPTLLGPTASVGGFFLGPIYYYFMTPFVSLFNYNPVGPAVMVALFGIATVWLVNFVAGKFFNKSVGLIASSLYAISPLVVAYSRSSWNPNPMPFFILLLLFCLYKGIDGKKWYFVFISGILFGIAMQLHYLTTFVGVIAGLYIIISALYDFLSRKFSLVKSVFHSILNFVFYFLGFVIGWSPFLLFEIRHDFSNIKSIIGFIFQSKDTGASMHFWSTVSEVFFRLFGRLVTYFPDPVTVNIHTHLNFAVWYYATLILAFLCSGFLVFWLLKSIKDRTKFLQFLLLFLWLFVGIFLFGFYKKQIYDYYFAFLFPLPFILTGAFLNFIYQKNNLFKFLSVTIFVILIALNLSGIPFRYPPNRELNQVKSIAQKVFDEAGHKPFNFALITGGNSDHAYRFFLTIWGNPPVTIQNLNVDPQRKSVTNQLLIVCEMVPCAPLGNPLWEVAGFGRAQIIGKWHVSVVDVYKLEHYKGK